MGRRWFAIHGHRGLRAGIYVVLGLSSSPLVFSLPPLVGWGVVALLAGAVISILGAGDLDQLFAELGVCLKHQ